jgi:hypothetical protein
MYTNELLEAKWEAQRTLLEEAEKTGRPYFDVVEEAARRWFDEAGFAIRCTHVEPRSQEVPRKVT